MKPLYWSEVPASKPVIRGTYFLHKSSGWLPYSEKDAELLEVCTSWERVGSTPKCRTCNDKSSIRAHVVGQWFVRPIFPLLRVIALASKPSNICRGYGSHAMPSPVRPGLS